MTPPITQSIMLHLLNSRVVNNDVFERLCGFLSIFDILSMELTNKQIRKRLITNKNIKKRMINELRSIVLPIMVHIEDYGHEINVYPIESENNYSDVQFRWFKQFQFFAETNENITFRSRNGDDDLFVVNIPIDRFTCKKNKIFLKESQWQFRAVFKFLRLLIWFCGGNNFSSPISITLTNNTKFYNESGDSIHFSNVKNLITKCDVNNDNNSSYKEDKLKLSFNIRRKKKIRNEFSVKIVGVTANVDEDDEATPEEYLTNAGMKPFLIGWN